MQKQRININGYDDIKTRAHNVQFISVVLILFFKKNVNDCLFADLFKECCRTLGFQKLKTSFINIIHACTVGLFFFLNQAMHVTKKL